MSLKVLNLDHVCVSSLADELNLSLMPTINIRIPVELANFNGHDIVKALASGKVWASRARGCRMELQLSFNGKPLDGNDRLWILESLGYHLRDAQLWSQLSISPSLITPQHDNIAKKMTDLTLFLNRSTESVVDKHPRGWLLDDVDVNPPESVLWVEFEKLQIQLDFHTFSRPSKRPKQHSKIPGIMDLMLLDFHPLLVEKTHLNQPEVVVEEFSSNLSVASPREVTTLLLRWLAEHRDHLYPSSEDKNLLARNTSLDRIQIERWFERVRRQQKMTPASLSSTMLDITSQDIGPKFENPEDEMLLPSFKDSKYLDGDELMLLPFSEEAEAEEEEELLFSQTPSLESKLSTISSSSLTPLKRCHEPGPSDLPALHSGLVTALTTHALHILLYGSLPRQVPSKSGPQPLTLPASKITTNTKNTATTLASLIPAIWSPGYKQLIAHHTRFLPIIERAVGGNWVRNAVGVGLRGMLEELANADVLTVEKLGSENDVNHDSVGNEGNGVTFEDLKVRKETSMDRLNAVVQSRLWSMMQQTLYDPKSAKRLRWDSASPTSHKGEADIDADVNLFASSRFGEQNGGENVEFDEDEEFLAYFDEQQWEASEQREVEMETDEMLFGNVQSGWDDGDEELLFGFGVQEGEEEEEGEWMLI